MLYRDWREEKRRWGVYVEGVQSKKDREADFLFEDLEFNASLQIYSRTQFI